MDYKAIITNVGAEKIASAIIAEEALPLLTFAVGDGNGSEYTPSPTQTALRHQVWSGGVTTVERMVDNPEVIKVDTAIPANIGGFTIRELGIFDEDGDLIIIGNMNSVQKVAGGTLVNDLVLNVLIAVGAEANITVSAESIAVASRADMVALETRVEDVMDDAVDETERITQAAVETVMGRDSYSKSETDALIDAVHAVPDGGVSGNILIKGNGNTETWQTYPSYTKGETDDLLAAEYNYVFIAQYPVAMAGYAATCANTADSTISKTEVIGSDGIARFGFKTGGTYRITDSLCPTPTDITVSYYGEYPVNVFRRVLEVTAPSTFSGLSVTVTDGTTLFTDNFSTGTGDVSVIFGVGSAGTWSVTASNAQGYSYTTDVTVTESGMSDVSLGFFSATIACTYPEGATCVCSDGITTITAPDTTGSYTFNLSNYGTYTLTATLGGETSTKSIIIATDGQAETIRLAFVTIYGISRQLTSTSTAWTRTDASVNFTATASVGTSAGASDFDECYPWSDMTRHTLATNDVMVWIPEFWYRRYQSGGVEYIKIADRETDGFERHPGSGRYVGAYETSSSNKSVSGASPTVSITRASARTSAKNKGTGWGIWDLATVTAIQMLYLVEFADNNAQTKIGRGYVDGNSSAHSTGGCNDVANLTGRASGTDGKTQMIYRGIEDFYGNIYDWVDGVNLNKHVIYVCDTLDNYADNTSTNYTQLSYSLPDSGYIKTMGMDTSNDWAMLPNAKDGSDSTYYPDYVYTSTSVWCVAYFGGYWGDASYAGAFYWALIDSSSSTGSYIGSRLLYIPS